MRLQKILLFLCLVTLMLPTVIAQSRTQNLKLSRKSPNAWFSLLVPKIMNKVERFADVDGGFYKADKLEIKFDYWTYENTPQFILNGGGNSSKSPILACSAKSQHTHTLRTRIDGKKAIIQQCTETDARDSFRFIYYVTFPKIKVFNGEDFHDGLFNLTVKYKSRRYLSIAKKVVHSINFEQ